MEEQGEGEITQGLTERHGEAEPAQGELAAEHGEKKKGGMAAWRKLWSAIPAVVLMGIIFWFSSKNAAESGASSNKVVDLIIEVKETYFGKLKTDRVRLADILSTVVRKGAHFSEYALLSALFLYWLASFQLPYRFQCVLAVAFSAAYAATDEFHQRFVAGRSCELRDVLIDTGGAVLGMLAVSLVRALVLRHKRKRRGLRSDKTGLSD